jgi:hypothetical protein
MYSLFFKLLLNGSGEVAGDWMGEPFGNEALALGVRLSLRWGRLGW